MQATAFRAASDDAMRRIEAGRHDWIWNDGQRDDNSRGLGVEVQARPPSAWVRRKAISTGPEITGTGNTGAERGRCRTTMDCAAERR